MTHVTLNGLRVVPGRCDARVFVLSSLHNIESVPFGCCLVLKAARPDVVVVFDRVAAIVCETGGRTSHLAILAREVGVPCFVGVSGVLKTCADLSPARCLFAAVGDELRFESER